MLPIDRARPGSGGDLVKEAGVVRNKIVSVAEFELRPFESRSHDATAQGISDPILSGRDLCSLPGIGRADVLGGLTG